MMDLRRGSPVFVQHHQAVHLTGQADALDLGRIYAAFSNDRTAGFAHRPPPILRILLRPAVLGLV